MTSPSLLAFRFAEAFAERCKTPEWSSLLTEPPEGDGNEHKTIGPRIAEMAPAQFPDLRVDWEGNARKGPQLHSYDLLGTGSHPDAAVLSPFRCAIEIDRETAGGLSQFKQKLMKAAVHTMCRAYDSGVFVYILRRSLPSAYAEEQKTPSYTSELIHSLRGHGLVVAFVTAPTLSPARSSHE